MITTLAPLGATHNIVLTLAYGDAPPSLQEAVATEATAISPQTVTVTAFLKPKGKGEPRTLQFKGPVADVERELGEKLPQAVLKIVTHLGTLEQLDSDLKAEADKAKKEAAEKKERAAKPAPPKTTVAGKSVSAAGTTVKKQPVKPAASKPAAPAKKKPAARKPAAPTKPAAPGSAVAALAKIAADAAKTATTTEAAPATPPKQEQQTDLLADLAARTVATTEDIDL